MDNKKQSTINNLKSKIKTPSLFPNFALKKPVTVIMIFLALLVVGYIAFTQISYELMPAGFTPPFLGVWVPYPNSNPQEVEEQIAKHIEDQIQTVSGVREIRTHSSSNGCWTFIKFAQEYDMDIAYSQLRDRMERVKSLIPSDIERIYIRKWSNDDDPIMWVALIQTEQYKDPYYLVEQHIQKRLERVDGVANVEIWGTEEKEILIYIKQDRVKSYKINLYEIIQQLRNDNFAISSGFVKEGDQKIYVRSLGKFKTLQDIQNLPIRGANLRLKDIAEVKYDVPERRWRQFIDGKKAITIGVFKESMANTVALTSELEDLFNNQISKDKNLSGFKFEILFNQGQFIEESIDNLQSAGLWGGFFALAVLYFFLRRMRMTLIVTLAIPLSVLFTLTVMYFMGWTLNLITMMGLMVSIGMVVDNSIVVLENIYKKRAEGNDTKTSSLWGSSEVSLAVTMATLTTVAVFLPLLLMNDDVGFRFIMFRIGIPVIISLLASLFVALVFIPLAATKIVSKREVQEPAIIIKSNNLYQKLLKWTLHNRIETSVILLLIIASMLFAFQNSKFTDESNGNINDIDLFFDLPENLTVDQVAKIINTVEDSVRVREKKYNIRTINKRYSRNWARLQVFLHPPEKRQWFEAFYHRIVKSLDLKEFAVLDYDEVVEDIKKHLPEFPGVEIRTSWRRESSSDDASIALSLYGDDTGKLSEMAEEIKRRLSSIKEIISVEVDSEEGTDEIQLSINREQAKKYGISPQMISGTVQYAVRGIPLPKYQTEEKEIDVRIQLQEKDRQNLSQLKNLTFFTNSGKEIPLDAVANFNIKKGFGEIHREDGKTYIGIKANTTENDMGKIFQKVDKAMAGFEMPYGYSWGKGSRFDRMQETNESFNRAVILAIVFVFIIMGFLFESFVLPLSVLVSIPFAFFGSFWLMYITGTPIDIMGFIGLIILVGIVINNAIVLIDLINQHRAQGYSRIDAIIEGGKHRFRPILMTAFTTIGGLIPMAVGNAQMIGIPYSPLGRTIIGGLLTSTILSLIAVPWAYTLFDDMGKYFRRLTALFLHKEKEVGEPVAVE